MESRIKYHKAFIGAGMLSLAMLVSGCESGDNGNTGGTDGKMEFPAFITPSDQYFKVSIGETPVIDGESYQLKISGTASGTDTFTLDRLYSLDMVEKTVTVECIGNPANGDLLGTAAWKGFLLYDLLDSLGIKEGTTTVKYLCADGYYTYNSLEELENRGVLAALYMNGDTLPAKFGFPLRIVFPGYYGVRQPGWIVEMELLGAGILDYWTRSGWNTDSAMAVDSKIFFPQNEYTASPGEEITIGGAAFGSRRISSVELTADGGATWFDAVISRSMDLDYVWVFWEAGFTPPAEGRYTIRSRARGEDGSVQPEKDDRYLDGTNSWPSVTVSVVGSK